MSVQNAPILEEERGAIRRVVSLMAHISVLGGQDGASEVLELSEFGCRLGTGIPIAAGDRLTLAFAGMRRLDAQCVWESQAEAGCVFDRPIKREDVDRLSRVETTQQDDGSRPSGPGAGKDPEARARALARVEDLIRRRAYTASKG